MCGGGPYLQLSMLSMVARALKIPASLLVDCDLSGNGDDLRPSQGKATCSTMDVRRALLLPGDLLRLLSTCVLLHKLRKTGTSQGRGTRAPPAGVAVESVACGQQSAGWQAEQMAFLFIACLS